MTRSFSRLLDKTNFASLLWIVAFVCMAVGGLQLAFTAESFDQAAQQRDHDHARKVMAERIDKLHRDQMSITTWDEAVLRTARESFDAQWVDENMVTWMHDFFNVDQVVVFTGDDRIGLAFADGALAAGDRYARLSEQLMPLVSRARDQLRNGKPPKDVAVWDVETIDGHLAVASAVPIVPYTDQVALPQRVAMHVSVQYLNSWLPDLQGDFPGAAFLSPLELAPHAVPIKSTDGRTVGQFSWTVLTPGRDIVLSSLPILLAVAVAIGGLVWLLGRRIARYATELAAKEAYARHLAFHDPLTGLPNRTYLKTALEEQLLAAKDGSTAFALHYLDIDQFKDVNDTLGHPAGDELIRTVASRLLAAVDGTEDLVARVGGDEFVIVQRAGWSGEKAMHLSSSILSTLRAPMTLGGVTVEVTASVGVAMAQGNIDASDLVRRADIALYRSKADGRNCVTLFTPEMDEAIQNRMMLQADLAAALARQGELYLAFQPLLGRDGISIKGAEALVRWQHPTRGKLSPIAFIPGAEESGLIVPLGEWILREACRHAVMWSIDYIAVNISRFSSARRASSR